MFLKPRTKRPLTIILLLLILAVLAACNGAPAEATPTQPIEEATLELPPADTPTAPAATNTEPVPSADVIVLVEEGQEEAFTAEHGPALQTWTQNHGFSMGFQSNLMLNMVQPNTILVLLNTNPPNLNALLSNLPDIAFVDLTGEIDADSINFFQMQDSSTARTDHLAFMAGYLAMAASADYRIGFIGLADGSFNLYTAAYRTGAEFYCGLCNPIYPPYVDYPVTTVINDQTQPQAVSALDALIAESVDLVYLSPALSTPEVLTQISISGLQIIASPAQAEFLGNNLIATIELDGPNPLDQYLDALLFGYPLESSNPILITSMNEELVSEGLIDHVMNQMDDLLDDYFSTGVE